MEFWIGTKYKIWFANSREAELFRFLGSRYRGGGDTAYIFKHENGGVMELLKSQIQKFGIRIEPA
jgi:hypothetical protein